MTDCEKTQALVEQYFVDGKKASLERARAHLEACPNCRVAYDRVFRAEAILAGEDGGGRLSAREKDLLLTAVLPGRRKRLARQLLPLATAVGLVTSSVLVVMWARQDEPNVDHLAARGESQDVPDLSLRPLCLSNRAGGAAVRSLVSGGSPGRCDPAETLGFTVRNSSGRPWYLSMVMEARPGQLEVIFPAGADAFRVLPRPDEMAMDFSIDLTDHAGEGLQIHALFSRDPVSAEVMRAWLEHGPPSSSEGVVLTNLVLVKGGAP